MKLILAATVLILAVCIVYTPSLKIPFILDDYGKIIRNPDIKSLDNIPSKLIYPYGSPPEFHRNDPSRPLTYLSLTLNYHFNKLEPYGYHVVNIALHVMVVLLLFVLGLLIFPLVGVNGLVLPFLSALLFAVHPINVNVVSYVIGRAASLATIFYVLAVIMFIQARGGFKLGIPISGFCFVLALASNQLALTLPAVILLTDFCFFSERSFRRVMQNWQQHAVYWLLFAAYLGLRLAYFGQLGDLEAAVSELHNRKTYFLTQLVVLWKYVGMILIPKGLSFEHVFNYLERVADPKVLGAIASYGILLGLLWKGLKSSWEIARMGLFGVLWFLITISPTSSLFPTTASMAENRVYLPSLGLYLLFVFAGYFILGRIFGERVKNTVAILLFGGYSAVLGCLTVRRNTLYQDHAAIWRDVIGRYPNHQRAHKNLAVEYFKQGKFKEMAEECEKAIILNPADLDSRSNLASAYYSLGRYKDALAVYQEILKGNPDYAGAYANMGMVYEQLRDKEAAIKAYKNAIRLDPTLIEPLNNLGGIYFDAGHYPEAAKLFQAALQIDPHNSSIIKNYKMIPAGKLKQK